MSNDSIKNISLAIVIPCYNEENRLPIRDYESFISNNPDVLICFVNDGSTDNTKITLNRLNAQFKSQAAVVDLAENAGKAEAVRQGIMHCNANFEHDKIAFLDADLATSLEECKAISSHINDDTNFVFGSRKKMSSNTIKRKYSRHLIGRMVAASINEVLGLDIHDTQCGCKIFTKDLSERLFKKPFISKWLFDVELFQRMKLYYGKEKTKERIKEVTLKKWEDKGASKVKASYFFKLWADLYQIKRSYSNQSKVETT